MSRRVLFVALLAIAATTLFGRAASEIDYQRAHFFLFIGQQRERGSKTIEDDGFHLHLQTFDHSNWILEAIEISVNHVHIDLDARAEQTHGIDDSVLPIDFAAVFRHFVGSGAPALMTVYRNQGRWDTSNVIFDGRMVTLYDKQRRTRPAEDFAFIDYGLSALTRRAVEAGIPAGVKADLSDLFHALSLRGELAGYESPERFYEIGSPQGLADFSEWVRARG